LNTEQNKDRWFAIVNPVAGSGLGLKDWPQISDFLHKAGIQFDALFTLHKYHAVELAVEAVNNGYRQIIVVGGDGTLHEVVNGLFIQKVTEPKSVLLAVIAVGTGNDWIRMFGIPKTYPEAIKAIVDRHTFLQDVGKVSYWECMIKHTRYLANVAGCAYDAAVCNMFNRYHSKGYRGKWLYIFAAIAQAFKYRTKNTVITSDGKEVFRGKMFSGTIGVCKYTGGGLSQTPLAIPDDGLFDLTIIPKTSRLLTFLRYWKVLYNDKIYDVPKIKLVRGAHLEIKSDPTIRVELDGEILGESDLDFEIIEKAIRVIVSEKFIYANA